MEGLATKNMKGFIFTVDAIFSLIVASVAVSILLYTYYISPVSYQQSSSEAYSLLTSMSQATMMQVAQGSGYADYAVQGYLSRQDTWPQYGDNSSLASSSPEYGPQYPNLLYEFAADSQIFPAPVAADGLVVFTTSSELYALNATTGSIVLQTPLGGPYVSSPMIYNHLIYVANALDLMAITESNSLVWSTPNMGGGEVTGQNGIITVADGFVQARGHLYYPQNGTQIQVPFPSTGINGGLPAAYWDGEFVTLPDPGISGSDAFLNGYTMSGNYQVLRNWGVDLAVASQTTLPSIGSNFIVAEAGTQVEATTTGGSYLWERLLPAALRGGAADVGGNLYVETQNGIFGFGGVLPSPQLLSDATITNKVNVTPSAAQNLIYFLPNGQELRGYSLATSSLLWNVTLPIKAVTTASYGNIALAYGNAYAAAGNTLFALGMCKADPYDSVLHAVATMYLNGNGACANMILNSSYQSENFGIFINNQYAPSLSAAQFSATPNSNSVINVTESNSLDLTGPITIEMWIDPVSMPQAGTGEYLVDKAGAYALFITSSNTIQLSDTQGHYAHTPNSAPISTGSWINVVATFSTEAGNALSSNTAIYINGAPQPLTSTGNWMPISTMGNPLFLGGTTGMGRQPFNGLMADVQLYGTGLSANQVEQIYLEGQAGPPLQNSGLVGWWPLEGDTNDYSGNAHTGFPRNIAYAPGYFVPPALNNAFEVSRASVPMEIDVGNSQGQYNVSVVVWR